MLAVLEVLRPWRHEGAMAACRLTLEAAHHSRLPQPRNSVTMMLTTTADRLDRLEGLCKSWPFPVTLNVYVPVISNTSNATSAHNAVAAAAAAVQEAFDRSAPHFESSILSATC